MSILNLDSGGSPAYSYWTMNADLVILGASFDWSELVVAIVSAVVGWLVKHQSIKQ